MALDEIEQFNKILENSRYILVVFSHPHDVDSICGSLAWKNLLEKKGKQVDVVCQGYAPQKNLRFLPSGRDIKPHLSRLQKFTIKIDVQNTKIDSISYDIKDDWLSIHLTPRQGSLTRDRLRTAQAAFKYDLIITVNTPDLESLGNIFTDNTDLFYKIPIINLDNSPANEHYGQINWVEITATSTCESIFKLMEKIKDADIDEDMATALLAGIISQTRSFKTDNITPYTLNIASRLMKLGADREKIIRHLYHNRSISSLKIWGQALSHLTNDRELGLAWTTITREDFSRSGASEDELEEVVEELIMNSPEAKIILMLYESPKQNDLICGSLVANQAYDALGLIRKYNPRGNKKRAVFQLKDKTLSQASAEITEEIKNKLK